MKTASELKYGEKVTISKIDLNHPSSRRIIEVGFTPGEEIELMNSSIFNDPLAFAVRGTLIAIRKHEAECIIVS
ncbi:MAG TPA: FeoA family protein [Ignavibacteriaceae bacterium]|nr:FeoA family protein [Ignavibacteriaceae bacterium]